MELKYKVHSNHSTERQIEAKVNDVDVAVKVPCAMVEMVPVGEGHGTFMFVCVNQADAKPFVVGAVVTVAMTVDPVEV